MSTSTKTNGYAISNGGDNRLRYNLDPTQVSSTTGTTNSTNKYYVTGTDLQHPNLGNAILLANTHKGYSYTATATRNKELA